jgi:hypothetical protein
MATARPVRLSKSRYIAGRQCPLQLWYRLFDQPAGGIDPVFWEGAEETAHGLFPGGLAGSPPGAVGGAAIERTRSLMADPGCPAIFEAAIAHDRLLAVVDVLQRRGESWDLIEVKTATRYDPTRSTAAGQPYISYDVAYQREVLRRAGIPIRKAWVYHLNSEYERRGELDLELLFRRRDVTGICEELAPQVQAEIVELLALDAAAAPIAEPGSRCRAPFECDFQDRCFARKPPYWIFTHLNRLNHHHRRWLGEAGVESVLELDGTNTARLPDPARRRHLQFRDVYATGRPHIGPGLTEDLSSLGPPSAYLDFETINPAIPRFDGTSPFQHLPFQYSLHLWSGEGDLSHFEYLAPAGGDPRLGLARHLVESLAHFPSGPILAYNASFERGCVESLIRWTAASHPGLTESLIGARDRIEDLLPVVSANVIAAGFEGSYSMKAVAPAVLGERSGYSGAEIADGLAAQRAFEDLAAGRVRDMQAEQVRRSLLAYCRLDTLNLHRVHRALMDPRKLALSLTATPAPD